MAKRQFSSGLNSMKFMQRAQAREQLILKEEAKEKEMAADDDHWVAPLAQTSGRCTVICEGDPKPGATIGRMSFKSYNPTIENLREEIQARRERARNAARGDPMEVDEGSSSKNKDEEDAKLSIPVSNSFVRDRMEEKPPKKKIKVETTINRLAKNNSKAEVSSSSSLNAQATIRNSRNNKFEVLQPSRGFRKPAAL